MKRTLTVLSMLACGVAMSVAFASSSTTATIVGAVDISSDPTSVFVNGQPKEQVYASGYQFTYHAGDLVTIWYGHQEAAYVNCPVILEDSMPENILFVLKKDDSLPENPRLDCSAYYVL